MWAKVKAAGQARTQANPREAVGITILQNKCANLDKKTSRAF